MITTIPEEQIELAARLNSLVADYIGKGGEIQTIPQGAGKDWAPAIAGAQKARKSGSAKLRTSASATKASKPKAQASI
jgi:hypothetical protein